MASDSRTDLKPLILHAFSTSPNPLKIGIALELLKLPYDIKIWDFGDDPRKGVKSERFASISENGKVPVLEDPNVDGGVTSWESGAIINYLRRRYDESGEVLGLTGKGSGKGGEVTEQDQVDFEKWEYLLVTGLGPMTGQMTWFRHYEKNPEALDRYEKQVYRCYNVLEGQLVKTEGKSVLPGGITGVDVHYYPWIRQQEFIGTSLEKYPFITKWMENMSAIKEFNVGYDRLTEAARLEDMANADVSGKILGADKGLLRALERGIN